MGRGKIPYFFLHKLIPFQLINLIKVYFLYLICMPKLWPTQPFLKEQRAIGGRAHLFR